MWLSCRPPPAHTVADVTNESQCSLDSAGNLLSGVARGRQQQMAGVGLKAKSDFAPVMDYY